MAQEQAGPSSAAPSYTSQTKDPRKIARRYQLELCKRAVEENIIVFLETGCGKTHIAVLLMYELRHLITKPGKGVCVFLAPTVHLVHQQSLVIKHSTDFKVGTYVGNDNRVKDHADWEKELQEYEVLVMTPQILLRNLEHCFMRMRQVALLIFDECHHAQTQNRHPYGLIMKDFYKASPCQIPRIFGMTASPVMGKSGFKNADYSKCINSLEDLLDAKVCTVDNRDELEIYIASPNIKIYFYDPVFLPDLVLYKKLDEVINQCITLAKSKSNDVKELQEKINLLWRLHDNVKFCCGKLGLWGGAKAVQIRLSDIKVQRQPMEAKGNTDGGSIVELYLTKASSAFNVHFMNDGSESPFQPAALEEPFFSKKLLLLIRILSSLRQQEGLKCLIFVKRIIAARSLASIIGSIESLHQWKCEFLVGFHSGLKNMSRMNMRRIVENFRSGKDPYLKHAFLSSSVRLLTSNHSVQLNLIVATNVAEEGLDIQTCCLVIRFDLPETVTSFIQSRGRARMQQSEYAFLVERENQSELNLIKDFTASECLINEEIKHRTSFEKLNNLVVEKRYEVKKTEASIGAGSSISLVHQYCAKLLSDEFFTPRPSFFYIDDIQGTICRILLPPNAAIRQIDGPPCASKDEARRTACLEACTKLHELGCLTDYLLPTAYKKERKLPESVMEPIKLQDECDRGALCEMLVPSVLRNPWSDSENSVSLNFYFLKLIPIPDDRSYQNFGLFLKSPLPEEAESMLVNLYLHQNRMVKVELVPSGIVVFDRDEITHAQKFQEMWLKIILDRHILFSDSISLGLKKTTQMEGSTFYLFLPVKMDEKQGKYVIDWTIVTGYLYSPLFFDGTSKNDERGARDGVQALKFENGDFDVRHIPNSIVTTSHNNLVFCVVDILEDVNSYSKLLSCSSTETYVELFKRRNDIYLLHPEQPLLKAKQLFNLKNLLQNRGHRETMMQVLPEHFVELPPEICSLKILSFSKEVASTLSLLPSVMHRLENLLVAIELKGLLSASFSEGSQISATRILEALTTQRCSETFSLERLEVLGDAFLKYVVGRHLFLSQEFLDEGKLTQIRSDCVNNLHLYELAVKNNLQVYVRDCWFDPSHYYAFGRPCTVQCDEAKEYTLHFKEADIKMRENLVTVRCNKNHHLLQRKAIGDVVEALIGACILDSGFKAANAFLRWIGIPVDFQNSDIYKVFMRSKNNLPLMNMRDFYKIEDLLGYKFQWKGLLVQAFTHPSYENHYGGCYQRLEFLGDAVLDYLITSYLYSVFPNLTPGQLTDLRSIAVSNNSFAQLVVLHSLQSYIISGSRMLCKAVENYVKFVQSPDEEKNLLESPKCPKVLGDIVESCAGAILLDSGLNLECVWRIMIPFLSSVVSFANVQLNPIRELQELCQSSKFELSCEIKRSHLGIFSCKKEVNISGIIFSGNASNLNKKISEINASQDLLLKLKVQGHTHRFKLLDGIILPTCRDTAKLIGYDETPINSGPHDDIQTQEINGVERKELVGTSNRACTASNETTMLMAQGSDASHESHYLIGGQLTAGSAKSRLYEICSVNCWGPPSFTCCTETGPSHLKLYVSRFTYKVVIKLEEVKPTILECIGEPRAKKKDAAEHAAEGALWYLQHRGFKR